MKNKQPTMSAPDSKQDKIIALLEHLVAVQMYRGGATQDEITASMGIAKARVNKFVKGVKAPKNHDKE